ncbi:hypothetical protein [Sphaerisporangium fuscum]|uniref:hypothetical protein n=1 Tax=Sphaerisporangium fuscum TaxID=2835868 RepID=UPI001BDCC73C|nr:hypothetical protein [Sphaerisporangium fuscum]
MTTRLHFAAVLAAAGPVLLPAFGVGRESAAWFWAGADAGPFALDSGPWETLFWSELLLPVVLAGLLLRPPRRATTIAVSAVGAVLALGLFTAIVLPGTDPCDGHMPAITPPWLLIVCCALATAALLAAGRSPLSVPRRPVAAWTAAVCLAGWTPFSCRIPIFTPDHDYSEAYAIPTLGVQGPGLIYEVAWPAQVSDADLLGLPVVVVALAAACAALSSRWARPAAVGAGLVLAGFALLDIVAYLSCYGTDVAQLPSLIKWHLIVAGAITALPTPKPARTLRRLWSRIPVHPRDLAVVIVVVVSSVWLVISSFS